MQATFHHIVTMVVCAHKIQHYIIRSVNIAYMYHTAVTLVHYRLIFPLSLGRLAYYTHQSILAYHRYFTSSYQKWHCSRSLGPDGLDCADHINLSLCLHLLNQRPNGYECTSATETITGEWRQTFTDMLNIACTNYKQLVMKSMSSCGRQQTSCRRQQI